jgi:hypothetical protein
MILHWPQITLIVINAIGLGIHLARNGQSRDESYSFGWQLSAAVLDFWLLYEGGFFGAV